VTLSRHVGAACCRSGYAKRVTLTKKHGSFYQQFHILLSTEDAKNGKGIEHQVQVLSKRLNLSEADWQTSHSKIFLRLELASKLEVLAKMQGYKWM
jgi:hypothetical protein